MCALYSACACFEFVPVGRVGKSSMHAFFRSGSVSRDFLYISIVAVHGPRDAICTTCSYWPRSVHVGHEVCSLSASVPTYGLVVNSGHYLEQFCS
jgi:hypothetical protein